MEGLPHIQQRNYSKNNNKGIKSKEKKAIVVNVSDAKQLSDFVLTIYFSDGTEQTIDFKPFVDSQRGFYAKYQDPQEFKKWKLDGSNIFWGENYDIIFPFEDVYNNTIKPFKHNLTLEQVANGAFK